MVVKFTQVGTNLILENKESLVQFSKNTPVKVKLSDNVFTKNSDITSPTYAYCLNWQDRYKRQIVQTPLAYNSDVDVYVGKVGLAATQIYGLSYVSLSATDAAKEITLTTSAAEIYIPRSVDPELAQVNTPDTAKSIVEKFALTRSGYDGTRDLGKIPVINKDGDLAVRSVHLLIDDDTNGGSLVLRGAVGQIIADIALSELREAIGSKEPEKISNSYWSGYKYPDGRAVLKWTLDVQNKALNSSNGVYATNKLFDSTYRKYPDIFVEKPEFRATYVPSPDRVHVGAYATFQRGNSETSSGSGDKYFYKNPPDVYIVCGNNISTTLLGELYMVAEGRWK